MPIDNDGTKYHGNDGQILLDDEGGSPANIAHVVEFTINANPADIDLSAKGSTFSDGTLGQTTYEVTATIWRSALAPYFVPGRYQSQFIFDPQSGGTDGEISGVFRTTSISSPVPLNGGVSYSVTFRNCGAVTVTDPVAA